MCVFLLFFFAGWPNTQTCDTGTVTQLRTVCTVFLFNRTHTRTQAYTYIGLMYFHICFRTKCADLPIANHFCNEIECDIVVGR